MFLVVALLVTTASAAAGGEVHFDELKGTYLSSRDGGCSLELHGDGTYLLTCPSRQSRRGEALVMAGGFMISTGTAALGAPALESPGEFYIPPPAPPARNGQWPPATQDPTSGPFVIEGSVTERSVWFEPLRWGPRLYLIPGGDNRAFCRAVQTGTEPRKQAAGEFFLRRGDHRKRAGTLPPQVCSIGPGEATGP
jgi:hypothetical protein